MGITETTLFWGFMLAYGVIMCVSSPKSRNSESFYKGTDDHGNPVGQWWLTARIFDGRLGTYSDIRFQSLSSTVFGGLSI